VIDIDLIRHDYSRVESNLARRRDPTLLGLLREVSEADRHWREIHSRSDALRARRNSLSEEIGLAKKRGEPPPPASLAQVQQVSVELESAEREEEQWRQTRDSLLRRLPNLLDDSVPSGKDDSENVVVSRWGDPRPPEPWMKGHGDLAENLGLVDFARARRVSGAGFYYLKGDLVLLDLALQKLALDMLVRKGFVPVVPPYMLHREPYEGVTALGDFETVMYKVDPEELFLIATSEHPLAAMYMGEILPEDSLPIKLAGVSPCFRREIGGHGVDQKGLFRVHQFHKVEQFVFCRPEDSPPLHEEIRLNAEEFFQALGIPYRVVNVCTGDLGTVAAKKYDIEAWFRRQGAYREVVSCSNCTDYQSRRLRIRMGRAGKPGKTVPHTLNSTMVATSRALVAILENGQREDGEVDIPRRLVPYFGGRETLVPSPSPTP